MSYKMIEPIIYSKFNRKISCILHVKCREKLDDDLFEIIDKKRIKK